MRSGYIRQRRAGFEAVCSYNGCNTNAEGRNASVRSNAFSPVSSECCGTCKLPEGDVFSTKMKTMNSLKQLLAKGIKYHTSVIQLQIKRQGSDGSQVDPVVHAAVKCFCGNHTHCAVMYSREHKLGCPGRAHNNWM